MAPRSPTLAFDPTPALEHDKTNYSPFDSEYWESNPSQKFEKLVKGVHFSEPQVPTSARHSIATTHVPLLPAIRSASSVPKQAFRIANPTPGIDINAYIENCRNLNEQLRQAHETERRAWNIERSALKAHIAELEAKLNKKSDSKRRFSNDSSGASGASFRSDFRNTRNTNATHSTRINSESNASTGPPVWKGPEFTPPVTRVFSNEDDVAHLPSISEDEPLPALEKEVSPLSVMQDRKESVSVPVVKFDESLDGINLKSGRTSSFVQVISPPATSPEKSPETRPKEGGLTVDMSRLISPLDQKLKLHAGHTPLLVDRSLLPLEGSSGMPTPGRESPPAPAPTKRPPIRPSENSDSYFSFVSEINTQEAPTTNPEPVQNNAEPVFEPEDDPSLKGPLMLDSSAKTDAANSFLEKVDAKLMEAANKPRRDSVLSGRSEDTEVPNGAPESVVPVSVTQPADDDMPVLKLKKGTNFGSAWGGDLPGRF